MLVLRTAFLVTGLAMSSVAFGQANTASLIDLTTNTILSNFVVGPNPQAVAWAGNSTAYVTSEDDDTLIRVDMTTSPPTPGATYTFPSGFRPHAVAINPAGTRALVTGDGTSAYIIDISVTPMVLVDTITVVEDAGGVAYYSAGNRAIVMNEDNILILDTSVVPAGVTTIAAGAPTHSVGVNPAGTRAAISLDQGGMILMDLTTSPPSLMGGPVGAVPADPLGIDVSPSGTRAVYVDEESPAPRANIIDISGSAPVWLNTIPLALRSPSAVAFNPVTGAVLIAGDDGVAVINSPFTSVATIIGHPGKRGATPHSLAINPLGTRALVLHEDGFFCNYPVTFGSVPVGSTATIAVPCQNTSSGNINVYGASLADGTLGFTIVNFPAAPFVLAPGETFTFDVRFTPQARGWREDFLDVSADFSSGLTVTGYGAATNSIPALSVGALALVAGLLAAFGALALRRVRRPPPRA